MNLLPFALLALSAPLLGSLLAGFGGRLLGRCASHCLAIGLLAVAWMCSVTLLYQMWYQHAPALDWMGYNWLTSASLHIDFGLLIDRLSVAMMMIVTSISLLVHIYSIGYMHDDPAYQRFFSYMSLFTFAMLILVTANNVIQLFFGWEGVGLVSYLLIGFWFKKPSAALGAYKAFIVNRVGDFGLLLGLALLLYYVGSLNYQPIFAKAAWIAQQHIIFLHGHSVRLVSLICILLFIGAMGKSAQMPLHVWLPESMEGPTPISALIHAATMVTAGVYLVVRMSPLFSGSPVALSVVLVVGATGALLLGLIGLVQNDIKRIIAYSTMSQLGYMMAAAGASAFSAAIFHLISHAFFKALLFLGAGSVILAMHHQQDIRKMGGLRSYLPITYITFLIGSCALVALPPFSGYYSKDAIIEAVHLAPIWGGHYAYICLLLGAFVTALYTFRLFFLTFHGSPRFDIDKEHLPHESPWVVWLPLVLLAVPSVLFGIVHVQEFIYTSPEGWLGQVVYVMPALRNYLSDWISEFHGVFIATAQAVFELPFWFTIAGIMTAWILYLVKPSLRAKYIKPDNLISRILRAKYGFDSFNDSIIVRGVQSLSRLFYHIGDMRLLDEGIVNGSAHRIKQLAQWMRCLQTGYLSYYLFVMALAWVILLATWVGWF